MNLIISRYQHRTRVLEELNVDWKQRDDQALQVMQFEELLSETLEMAGFLTRSQTLIADLVFEDAEACPLTYEERLQVILQAERGARTFNDIMNQASQITQQGFSLRRFAELAPALENLDHSIALLKSTCPEVDENLLALTADDIQRGDFRSSAECLRDAQNTGL